jgi:magnesium-transporting ATPase (P-type)
VIRNGKDKLIHSEDLLVGDILHFYQGDLIPCDGILTNVLNNIKVS